MSESKKKAFAEKIARKKKRPKASPNEPTAVEINFDDDGDFLPYPLAGVWPRVDASGKPRGDLVLALEPAPGVLEYEIVSKAQLAMQRYDAIAQIAAKYNMYDYVSRSGCRELGNLLLRTSQETCFVVERDGFTRLHMNGKVFEMLVWCGKVHWLGQEAPCRIVVLPNIEPVPKRAGSLDEWQENVGFVAKYNPYVLVGMSAATWALMARPLGMPTLVLALIGGSGQGKTTVAQIIQSMVAPAGEIESFSGTEKGVRSRLQQIHDRPACRDEMRQAENMHGLVRLIFDIGNGASRATASSQSSSVQETALHCGLILANEVPLMELLAAHRVPVHEGVAARYFELHACAPKGMFHRIPKGQVIGEFVDHIKGQCAKYYGAYWNTLVTRFSKKFDQIKQSFKSDFSMIEASLTDGFEIPDVVTRRMIKGLASWAFAGRVAIELGLLKVEPSAVTDAFRLVIGEHLQRLKHATTPMGEQVVNEVRNLIDRNAGKFPRLAEFHSVELSGICGYRHTVKDKTLFLILPSVFDELIGQRFGREAALRHLHQSGYLNSDIDGSQLQVRIPQTAGGPEQRKRFYAINGRIRFDSAN